MSSLKEPDILDKNMWREISEVKGRGQLIRVPMSEIVQQMAIDHLNPKSKDKSNYIAIVRGVIDYREKKISYMRLPPSAKDAYAPGFEPITQTGTLQRFEEKYIDFLDYMTNTDPFHSPLENQQRISDGGIIKNFEKKKILLLEIPTFWSPDVQDLGKNVWLQSLIRMEAPKLKNKREFQIGEIIKVTFANMSNYDGAKFVEFPVEGAAVFDETISFLGTP